MATRVPVPEDYEGGVIVMAGRTDDDIRYPDVELSDRDHARNLHVRSDDDGRYVGCDDAAADAVADYLGVTTDDTGTCEAVKSDGEVCGRDLPCPYHDAEGED